MGEVSYPRASRPTGKDASLGRPDASLRNIFADAVDVVCDRVRYQRDDVRIEQRYMSCLVQDERVVDKVIMRVRKKKAVDALNKVLLSS